MITGFQCSLSVDDGGSGGTGASTAFAGLVTLTLPSLESQKYDATELTQTDPYMREEPSGLVKVGETKAEMKFTKANYQRLQALLGDRGKTFILVSPDDQTSGTATKLTTTFTGFISKLDEVKFEKTTPVSIPFEVTVSAAPAYS